MEPAVETSVKLVAPGKWVLGHSVMIEVVDTNDDANDSIQSATSTWKIGDQTYRVYRGEYEKEWKVGQQLPKFHVQSLGRILHLLGENLVCKVAAWSPIKPLEAESMQFIQENVPSIRIPKVYYSFIDAEWERSYLVMERIHGKTLEEAWDDLSIEQIHRAVGEIVEIVIGLANCDEAAELRAPGGQGVSDDWLLAPNYEQREQLPKWLWPIPHPPMNIEQLSAHLRKTSYPERHTINEFRVEWLNDEGFRLAHGDLSPKNIIIADFSPQDEDTQPQIVKGILDWEHAGYRPLWYLWFQPLISKDFNIENLAQPYAEGKDPIEYRSLLAGTLCRSLGYEETN